MLSTTIYLLELSLKNLYMYIYIYMQNLMLTFTISGLAQDGQQHGPPVRGGRNTLPPIPYQEMSSHQNDKGGGGDHVSTSSSTLSSRSSSVVLRRRTLGNQQPPPSATAGIPAAAAGLLTTNNKKSPLSDPQAWEGNTGNTAWHVQVQQQYSMITGLFVFLFLKYCCCVAVL